MYPLLYIKKFKSIFVNKKIEFGLEKSDLFLMCRKKKVLDRKI